MSPIELTLGDGSVVKGADLDDAFDNLAKMKANTSTGYQREQSTTFLRRASPYPHARARRRKRVEESHVGFAGTRTMEER